MSDTNNRFGNNLRHLRTINHKTIKELAKELNFSESAIKNYEGGRRTPSNEDLQKICEYFGVVMDSILYSDLTNMQPTDVMIEGHQLFDLWMELIPLVSSDRAMKNENFCCAYETCKSLFDRAKKGFSVMKEVVIGALDQFSNSFDEDQLPEAYANMMWIYFLFWNCIGTEEVNDCYEDAITNNKRLKIDYIEIKKMNNTKDSKLVRQAFIDEIDEKSFDMLEYLNERDEWSDLAHYYLALKYLFGFIDSGLQDEMNKMVGEQLLFSLAKIKNKYALQHIKVSLSLLD